MIDKSKLDLDADDFNMKSASPATKYAADVSHQNPLSEIEIVKHAKAENKQEEILKHHSIEDDNLPDKVAQYIDIPPLKTDQKLTLEP